MKLGFVAVLSFVLSVKDIKNVLLNLMLMYRLHFPLKNTIGNRREREGFVIRWFNKKASSFGMVILSI